MASERHDSLQSISVRLNRKKLFVLELCDEISKDK